MNRLPASASTPSPASPGSHRTLMTVLQYIALLAFCISSPAAAASTPSWQAEWEKNLDAAKKEGQVSVYTKAGYDNAFAAFQKRYPEIKVTSVAGQAVDVTNRLLAERRAQKFLADVFSFGVRSTLSLLNTNGLDPVRPVLLLPEVTDESKWYDRHVYSDAEKIHVFRYLSVAEQGIGYNTKLLPNPSELKSYLDFLNPKWKGKIVARDVRTPGPGNGNMLFWYHHRDLGPAFLRKLFGEMGITLTRNALQATDWTAQGKFVFCFFCSGEIEKAKEQGLPVDVLDVGWKEGTGIVSHSGNLALMRNAPHPNAARIFINWLLSREGQIETQRVLAKVQPADSRRIDIPKDDVPADVRRKEGIRYMDMDSRPEYSDIEPVRKLLIEVVKKD
jgi:iron(III) transport system substrate-binding protein